MSETTVRYSLKKKAIEVPIEQEDGSVVVYELRRASGEAIETYLDANSQRMDTDVDDEGHVHVKQIKTYKDTYVSLLKVCLYKDGVLVKEEDIRKFPYDVQQGLYEDAQTVNGLNKKGAAAAKK
jgi:hypothetical protein